MNIEEQMKEVDKWVDFNDHLGPRNQRLRQGREELKELYETVIQKLNPCNICLEIGLKFGGTHFFWKLFFKQVISIDIMPDYCKAVPAQLTKFGMDISNSQFICGDSNVESTLNETKKLIGENNKLDFLFIDGAHNTKALTTDFEFYYSLVRTGGIIAIHDAGNEHRAYPAPVGPTEFYQQVHDCAKLFSNNSEKYKISKVRFINSDYTGIAWFVKK